MIQNIFMKTYLNFFNLRAPLKKSYIGHALSFLSFFSKMNKKRIVNKIIFKKNLQTWICKCRWSHGLVARRHAMALNLAGWQILTSLNTKLYSLNSTTADNQLLWTRLAMVSPKLSPRRNSAIGCSFRLLQNFIGSLKPISHGSKTVINILKFQFRHVQKSPANYSSKICLYISYPSTPDTCRTSSGITRFSLLKW